MWRPEHFKQSDTDLSVGHGDARFKLDDNLASVAPELYHVNSVIIGLYGDHEMQSANLNQLLYGEPFEVHHTEGHMVYGRSLTDGYVGWLFKAALQPGYEVPSHIVRVPLAPLYGKPKLKQTPLDILPATAMVWTTGESANGYDKLACGRWIYSKHIAGAPIERSTLDIAMDFLAAPYVWGGRTAMGIDCSGLVQIVLAMQGKRAHRDSDMQFKTIGKPVDRGDLQAGDLAFFPGHVGIMADSENMLHANATHMAVTIDPLDEVIGWVAAETDGEPFSGGKRL